MATQSMCKHVDSLRTSLQDLSHQKLTAQSAAKIKADLTAIQTQVTALKGQGGPAFSSQMNSLSAAVTNVKKAAGAMSTPPTVSQVQAVVTALTALQTQAKAATAAMNKACPR